jgi:hypothetical protein
MRSTHEVRYMCKHKGENDLDGTVGHEYVVLLLISKHALPEVVHRDFLAMCGSHVVLVHVIRIKDGDFTLQASGLRGMIKCPEPYEASVDPKKVEPIEDTPKAQIDFIRGVRFDEMKTLLHLDRVTIGLLCSFQPLNILM